MKKKLMIGITTFILLLVFASLILRCAVFVRLFGLPRFKLGYEDGNFDYVFFKGMVLSDIKMGITSLKTSFPIDDVTVKFHYGVLSADQAEQDDSPESYYLRYEDETDVIFGIYVSTENRLYSTDYLYEDYRNIEDHIFVKEASSKEVFDGEYWHNETYFGVSYNHKEDFTIPAEIFTEDIGEFYIRIIPFTTSTNHTEYKAQSPHSISISYKKIDDDTIKLISSMEYYLSNIKSDSELTHGEIFYSEPEYTTNGP